MYLNQLRPVFLLLTRNKLVICGGKIISYESATLPPWPLHSVYRQKFS